MKQALYLFTRAKGLARMNAAREACPWFVVRERHGFVARPVRDFAQECWKIGPLGEVQHLTNAVTND